MRESSPGVLPWATAARIAARDLRSSWMKFAFVVIAVALGVGSLTGVRSFSLLFRRTLFDQARTIMAADLSTQEVHSFTAAELAQIAALQSEGIRATPVTQTVSMASIEGRSEPLLVSLKAVDPAQYPFYGAVRLASGKALASVLSGSSAVVSPEFLLRMHAQIGDTLVLGNSRFRIAGVIESEPDRISSSFNIGPRVMISEAALAATGLVLPGARVNERMLFRLPPEGAQKRAITVDRLRQRVEAMLPDAQVTDFREANPALSEGVRRSTAMLTLVSLVTLVLSAIGVGMAMRAHLAQRLETIAIMKAMGARSSQVMRIYGLETIFLGTAGALVGIIAGAGVARAFPPLLAQLTSLRVPGELALAPVLVGLATGILTTLLFTLPSLVAIRGFRPLAILRRNVDSGQRTGMRRWCPRDRMQIGVAAVLLLGLAAIAGSLTDSAMVGGWFAGGLLVVLLVLLLAAAILLRGLRWLLGRELRLSPVVRQGLRSLYRPGNQSAAVLAALGVGVMLILTIFLVERAIVRDLSETSSPKAPNIFLVDISPRELPGLMALIRKQPAVEGPVETVPVVSASITAIDGVAAAGLHLPHTPQRMLRTVSLTWSAALPVGETVRAGRWWRAGAPVEPIAPLAVNEETAKRLQVHVGSAMDFAVGARTIHARVAALYHSDGEHLYGRTQFILPPEALLGEPVIWYGAFHADSKRVPEVERALYAAYPTVTLINIADVVEVIHKVVGQIARILRFLVAFAMLAGGIILASSIAATRLERVREVAILKSLGARRRQIVTMLSVEFLVLGGIAGAIGAGFALALSWALLGRLDVRFHPGWLAASIAVIAAALLAVLVGWLASLRILEQKPLQVLREQ